MITAQDIIQEKNAALVCISPDSTIADAVKAGKRPPDQGSQLDGQLAVLRELGLERQVIMKAFIAMAVLLIIAAVFVTAAAAGPPAPGDRFPDFILPAPPDPAHGRYLGVAAAGHFRPSEIDAAVLIVEVFSMYCPYCQKEAPQVNRLHQAIEARPETAGKVKLIGLGAGNSPMEVDLFRETYGIGFPLFADGDLAIHKQLGEVRTPYFFAAKRLADGALEVIFSSLGGIADVERFLDDMVRDAGLRK